MVDSYSFDKSYFDTKQWHAVLSMMLKIPEYSEIVNSKGVVIPKYKSIMDIVVLEIPHDCIEITDCGVLDVFLSEVGGTRATYDRFIQSAICDADGRLLDFKFYGDAEGKGFYVQTGVGDAVFYSFAQSDAEAEKGQSIKRVSDSLDALVNASDKLTALWIDEGDSKIANALVAKYPFGVDLQDMGQALREWALDVKKDW